MKIKPNTYRMLLAYLVVALHATSHAFTIFTKQFTKQERFQSIPRASSKYQKNFKTKRKYNFQKLQMINESNEDQIDKGENYERRSFLSAMLTSMMITTATFTTNNARVYANDDLTEIAEITDKIYIDFQGLPAPTSDSDPNQMANKRIVIGLFGKNAPEPVSILKQLVSTKDMSTSGSNGYNAKCQPKAVRTLQREQLEANKVYNTCKEYEEKGVGVTYELSTVWRVDKGKRIDVGAVAGKFVAREFPNFTDTNPPSTLRHTIPGVVSVRRGNDGGFGFTILPPGATSSASKVLDEDNIVVGRIIEGMDVIETLNNLPVVQSSSVNYMSLSGGAKGKTAPDRSCRYGGPMYCNELKPLKKISIIQCGLL